MSLTPKENNLSLSKFESMLKTNSVYFFDSAEFEEIIQYYIDSGKNALAKKAINLGLKQHPDSVMLKLLKAELLIFDDELAAATTLLKELQAIEPNNEEIYIQQASIFSKKDDHKNAIKVLEIALKISEDEADIFSMIGMEYLYLDDFNKARENFIKCVDADFEDYAALYNVIYCFDMQNMHKEAAQYLDEYINKDPYSEVAWHQLGRQYFILENYTEALKAFDYAVLIDEFFVGAYLEKAKTLEELKNYEQAIINYKKAISLEDPTAFTFMRIAACYEKLKKNKLAIQWYKKAVHEDPLLEKGWLAITNLNLKDKKFKNALFNITKAIEIDDQNSQYWRKYAEINLKLNFFDEAIIGFKNCILLQDYSLIVWVGLCDVLIYIGEYNNAVQTLLEAKTIFEDFAEIEFRLSALYFKLNQNEMGEIHLKKALAIDFDYHKIIKELFPEVFSQKKVINIIAKFN
jgi:tetratricopeptide (TPR) repeat protein